MNTSTPSVETILAQAVEIASAAQRQAYVEQACGGDAELKHRVERLIGNHFQAGSFLERPAVAMDPDATAGWEPAGAADGPGTVIGPYKLLEQIGEGGMGLVFVADQQQPIKRRVALKIIKPGMDSRQVVARFEAERQALAMMDHPHIAKVHDGGATPEGRPFFVMELVKGTPITDHCDEHRLTTRQRLELFVDVCHALQHAHQKGIIHRDLKPSNVLVSVHDVTPVVKVIDFGVAKAIGGPLTDKTVYTAFSQMVGTPLYMSPEQAGLSDLDVDTRSDVYSLGVLLYELLTGTTPCDSETLKTAGFDEMRRIIREDEPPRPSTRLSALEKAKLSTICERRGTDPRKLNHEVRGELDWIVMKALEKDRERRYESASALAADIRRYLNDEPVQACPPSTFYRLRKFVRRHRAGLSVAAVVLMSSSLGGRSWLWWVEKRAGAEGEARVALREASGLLEAERWPEALSAARRAEGVLAGVGADQGLRHQVRELVKDLGMALALQEARLRVTSQTKFGWDWEGGDAAYTAAFQEYRLDVDGLDTQAAAQQVRARPIHRRLVAALDDWAYTRRQLKAEGWRRRLAVARAADPDARRNRLRDALEGKDPKALEELADADPTGDWSVPTLVLLGRLAQGKALGTRVGERATVEGDGLASGAHGTALGERVAAMLVRAQQQHPDDFWINQTLASVLHESRPRRLEEEIRFASVAVALQPRSPGAHLELGSALHDKGRQDEAIAEYRESIRLKKDDPVAHYNLGTILHEQGRLDEAIAELREAVRLRKDWPAARTNLGRSLYFKGRLDDAIAEFRQALASTQEFPEADVAHRSLGNALYRKGELDQAIAEFREAIRLKPDGADHHNNLGNCLHDMGRLGEAIAEIREAVRLEKDDPLYHYNLGSALRDKGQLDEAIAEYREAIRLKQDYPEAHTNLGNALKGKGRMDEAIAEYCEALRTGENFPEAYVAHLNLGLALRDECRPSEAIAEYREALRLKPGFEKVRALLRQAEVMAGLEARLPALLQGKDLPKNATERLALAGLCQGSRK